MMALTMASALSSEETTSIFTLGRTSTVYSLATIDFLVALLATKTLHLGDRHAFNPSLGQSFFYIIEFERLDDGFNFFS